VRAPSTQGRRVPGLESAVARRSLQLRSRFTRLLPAFCSWPSSGPRICLLLSLYRSGIRYDRVIVWARLSLTFSIDFVYTESTYESSVAQVILLEETWAELFLICAIQWSLPVENGPFFSVTEHTASMPAAKVPQVYIFSNCLA
jgi:hypothetical protein